MLAGELGELFFGSLMVGLVAPLVFIFMTLSVAYSPRIQRELIKDSNDSSCTGFGANIKTAGL